MTQKVIRLITLVLAIALVASLAVGCGGDSNTPGGSDGKGEAKVDGMLAEVNPEDYKGTKVVLATWKDPFQNEDGPVCEKFEKEYGIDFDWQMIDQGEYVNTIAAAIASNQQPDVFFENGDFPEASHRDCDGDTGILDILKAYHDAGWNGYIRPDHGRHLWGEGPGTVRPGYGLYDRALGIMYMLGVWDMLDKLEEK